MSVKPVPLSDKQLTSESIVDSVNIWQNSLVKYRAMPKEDDKPLEKRFIIRPSGYRL